MGAPLQAEHCPKPSLEACTCPPPSPAAGPLPTILVPHGGPHTGVTMSWIFSYVFLASQGYASECGARGVGRGCVDAAGRGGGLEGDRRGLQLHSIAAAACAVLPRPHSVCSRLKAMLPCLKVASL